MRFRIVLAVSFVLSLALAAFAEDDSLPQLNHFDPLQADRQLDPCQDFHKFACSKFFAANPIPADQVTWGTASNLQLWNETVLRQTMEQAALASSPTPVQQKVGDYWAACMDEKGINEAANRDLGTELRRIGALRSKASLIDAIVHIHQTLPAAWQGGDNQTAAPLFGFGSMQDFDNASLVVAGFDQGGLGLPNRDFYLKDDDRSKEIRAKYKAHIQKMLALAGESAAQATQDAETVLAIETELAQAQMDNITRRDPKNLNNRMTLDQAQALAPSLNLKQYVKLMAAPEPHHYIVTSPKFFQALEHSLQTHPLPHWQAYLRWQVVHYSAPFLTTAFVEENFDFNRNLTGAKQLIPRWRRCVRNADRDLGEVLGQAYVERAFPPESKQRMLTLVSDIKHALERDIATLDWMAPETKKAAVAKLNAMEDKIGYPNHWRDYSSVKITRDSYLHNAHAATAFESHRQLAKIGKPVDRTEWVMTPPTIDAYNDGQLNTINFPAGILQPPFFDKDRDDAVNYGAIGAVIGHEIIHGFDDQGRKFDAKGNLKDWWTEADGKAYEERGKCIANEYTQDVPEAGVKQDGRLTQGEDTADNGGTRIALAALEYRLKQEGESMDQPGPDGWTPRQRFYLSYANVWCSQLRPEIIRTLVLTNPHSISQYRVNNVVSNQPEFQRAFGCKKGAPMVRENACRVW